jgi:hypothetical protein
MSHRDGHDYDNNWNYNECHKPRRRRHHKKQYNDCWDYSRS